MCVLCYVCLLVGVPLVRVYCCGVLVVPVFFVWSVACVLIRSVFLVPSYCVCVFYCVRLGYVSAYVSCVPSVCLYVYVSTVCLSMYACYSYGSVLVSIVFGYPVGVAFIMVV